MKLFLKIIIVISIVAGGVFMANQYGNCNSGKYAQYSSEDPELNIMMDYISDWKYQESRGSHGSYAQVQFYGEVEGEGNFAPTIVVTLQRSEKVELESPTIGAMADDITEKRMFFEDAKIISRSETKLLDMPAIDMTLSYKQMNLLRDVNAKSIPFKERIIIFKNDDRYYTLRYVNPEEAFDAFEEDFLHCIKSLVIKDSGVS